MTVGALQRHGLALLASTAVLGAIPVLLYLGAILVTGDIGGPLNLVIIPVLSGALALGASVCVLTPLSWVGARLAMQRWLLALVVLPTVTAIVWSPAVWFYGCRPEARNPPSLVVAVGGVIYAYLLIGLLAQFACGSLLERRLEKR